MSFVEYPFPAPPSFSRFAALPVQQIIKHRKSNTLTTMSTVVVSTNSVATYTDPSPLLAGTRVATTTPHNFETSSSARFSNIYHNSTNTVSSSDSHNSIQILIGSGNLGNAAPDETSLNCWIPADGYYSTSNHDSTTSSLPTNETTVVNGESPSNLEELQSNSDLTLNDKMKFPLRRMTYESNNSKEDVELQDLNYHCLSDVPNDYTIRSTYRQYQLIVLGMQESTFDPPQKDNKIKQQKLDGVLSSIPERSNNDLPNQQNVNEQVGDGFETNGRSVLSEGDEHPDETNSKTLSSLVISPTAKVVGQTVNTITKTTSKTVRTIHKKTGKTINTIQALSTNRDHCKTSSKLQQSSVLSKTYLNGTASMPTTEEKNGTNCTNSLGPEYGTANAIGSSWMGGTHVLHAMLEQRLPSYERIVSFQRGEMRLTILVHKDHIDDVRVLHVAAQNTGRAGLANKGGIVSELLFGGHTRLSFLTAHLEAHEGAAKYQTRISTIADILGGTTKFQDVQDCSLTAHFSFVMGDLNFRTELPNCKELDEDEHKQIVRDMVNRKDWDGLNDIDELHRALQNKECLVGYHTLLCNFPPTFKLERKNGYEYIDKRRPSYTDRILWKTNHGLDNSLQPMMYEPIDNFASSDHKPIRGAFSVQLNESYSLRPKLTKRQSTMRLSNLMHKTKQDKDYSSSFQLGQKERFHVFVSAMSCDIYSKNKSNLSLVTGLTELYPTAPNPYLCLISDPPAALHSDIIKGLRLWCNNLKRTLTFKSQRRHNRINHTCYFNAKGFPRSSIHRQRFVTQWDNEEIHTEIRTHNPDGSPIDLAGAMLRLTVMDHFFRTSATGENDGVVGTVVVNLVNLMRACRHHSKKPVSAPRINGTAVNPVQPPSRPATVSNVYQNGDSHYDNSADSGNNDDPIVTLNIDEPMIKNGVETGHLKCKVEVWWMDDRAAKSFGGLGHDGFNIDGRHRRQNNRTNINASNSNSALNQETISRHPILAQRRPVLSSVPKDRLKRNHIVE
jgi:hypothetical protein